MISVPIPAEQDHADCESPLIQVLGSNRYSGWMLNMNVNPSSEPSERSIHIESTSESIRRTNKLVMRMMFAFSMPFAPDQMNRTVIAMTRNWKKMTRPAFSRKAFQTAVVSTPSRNPPVSPSRKYWTHQPATTA